MNKNLRLRPKNAGAPAANYELGMSVPTGSKLVFTAGIGGVFPDGSLAKGIGPQASQAWQNIVSILGEAQMSLTDIVSYTTYVVVGSDFQELMSARDQALGPHRAASVLIPVPSLIDPEWLVEISVVAAKADVD